MILRQFKYGVTIILTFNISKCQYGLVASFFGDQGYLISF